MTRLPGFSLLQCTSLLVPESHRDEWLAEWHAELAHSWKLRGDDAPRATAFALRLRCIGAVRDAIWMRRRYHSTHRSPDVFGNDVRYAIRSLARKPGFSAVVITTLALCIGANTAIFSVVNSVLLDGLPYGNVDRLVAIWSNDTNNKRERNQASVGDYRDMRARNRTFESIAAYFPGWNVTYTAPDAAERLDVGVVSANFLTTLRTSPLIGRNFQESADTPGGPNEVILTHAFWTRNFGQDTNVVGRRITLDGQVYDVVGVMPNDFVFPEAKIDLLGPMPMLGSYLDRREVHLVTMIGRLGGDATLAQARQELATIAAQLEKEFPAQNEGFGVTVLPIEVALLGDVRKPILMLFAAVGLVLLIGCANVASLMLSRAATRRSELALRAALGAGRGRIVRQLLTESAIIAAMAVVVGSALAWIATKGLTRILPPELSRLSQISMNTEVLLFTLLVSVAVTFLCGLWPALYGAREAMSDSLKDAAKTTRPVNRRRAQRTLVVSELALSLVLVTAAGLVISSFSHLVSVDPGFRTSDVVRMKISLAGTQYGSVTARRQHWSALLDRVRSLPGVVSAGGVSRFPLHDGNITTSVRVEGSTAQNPGALPDADLRIASEGYFEAMGIRLLHGRTFSADERIDSAAVPVAVINETMAREMFGSPSPIGKRMQLGGQQNGPFFEVIGVVGDIHDASLRESPRSQVFQSVHQVAPRTISVVIHHEGSAGSIITGVRSVLRELDPSLPVYDVQRIDDVMTAASVNDRFSTVLLSGFSGLALVLAIVGTYGVIAYGVNERTREIGIRMALGAPRSNVQTMVMWEGLTLLAIALPLGLLGAWAFTRVLQGLLYGVSAFDPATVASAMLVLAIVTACACYLPARRASMVDPIESLK